MKKIIKQEGVRGLYKGMVPNYLKGKIARSYSLHLSITTTRFRRAFILTPFFLNSLSGTCNFNILCCVRAVQAGADRWSPDNRRYKPPRLAGSDRPADRFAQRGAMGAE